MKTMNDLLKIAARIKDRELRKKVEDVLKHPSLCHNGLARKYTAASLKEVPASVQFHHVYRGGLIAHTYEVTTLSLSVAETLSKAYGIGVDMDALTAAALVHDIGKLWSFKKSKQGWVNTDLTLDHTMLGTAELYCRGFPENVLHIVASHFGFDGPTPPQTLEAALFHYVDTVSALKDSRKQGTAISFQDIINMLGIKKPEG
jgi:putative nucleotidyltransferase with HDIG domain